MVQIFISSDNTVTGDKAVLITDFSYSYSNENSKDLKGLDRCDKTIFRNFNLSVEKGEWIMITGSSGCGKSTLICSLCGLAQQTQGAVYSGDILLFGKKLKEYSQGEMACTVGVAFQTPQNRTVAPTVQEEIWFGLQNLCLSRQEILKRSDEIIAALGLEKLKNQNPSSLSGGQQQLVSFGAVVAMQPKIYLLDEVISQLDEDNRKVVLSILKKLHCDGATIIMVEHSPEINKNASRIVALEGKNDRD